jgi:hypothetical protein
MPAEDELVAILARYSGLRRADVRRFVQLETLALDEQVLQPSLVRRLRRLHRLRRDLGLSLDAGIVILRLLDRIEVLEGRSPWTGVVRVLEDDRAEGAARAGREPGDLGA